MDWSTSFERMHSINKRATPMMMMKYKHCLELHRLYNSEDGSEDWINLHFQQNFNNRNDFINIFDNSKLKIGKNRLVNQLTLINGLVKYEWLNHTFETFKIKCKKMFLS